MQAKGASTWPATPGAPTIGTATAGIANCASVTFTAPAYTGYPAGISSYTAVSTPGCITACGASSPVTVTGLTSGTSYTFRVRATGASGTGPLSGASNSITATVVTCAAYTTPGTYSWVAPTGVTSVAAVAIGGGRAGSNGFYCCGSPIGGGGGQGGSLSYRNSQSVTPGASYTVTVGAGGSGSSGAGGGNSSFVSSAVLFALGGNGTGSNAGTFSSIGGSSYGNASTCNGGGGGGAGGYAGTAGFCNGTGSGQGGLPTAGTGGGGGGGGSLQIAFGSQRGGSGGGGTGIFGQGANGAAGTRSTTTNVNGLPGGGGSGGANGIQGSGSTAGAGGGYGGGGGGGIPQVSGSYAVGASGAVRIVWAGGARGTPSFPSTCVGA